MKLGFVVLLLCLPLVCFSAAASCDIVFPTGVPDQGTFFVLGNPWSNGVHVMAGEKFVLKSSATITGASVRVNKLSAYETGIVLRIETDNGAGLPSGILADPKAQVTIPNNNVNNYTSSTSGVFSTPIILPAGTYYLVIDSLSRFGYTVWADAVSSGTGSAVGSFDGPWVAYSGYDIEGWLTVPGLTPAKMVIINQYNAPQPTETWYVPAFFIGLIIGGAVVMSYYHLKIKKMTKKK